MPLMRKSSSSSLTDLLSAVGSKTMKRESSSSMLNSMFQTKPKPQGLPSLDLCLGEFNYFVYQTLSKEDVAPAILEQLYGCLERGNLQDTLTEMEHALDLLLKSTSSLPVAVVGELHTYLGLIYMEQNNNNSAVDSFMRAIWFKSRTPENTLAIAQANHRLGLAYARRKQYEEAFDLLDRAIAAYELSSDLYVLAKEDRHDIFVAQQLQLLTKNGKHTIRAGVQLEVAESKARRAAERRNRRTSRQGSTPKRSNSTNTLMELAKSFGQSSAVA